MSAWDQRYLNGMFGQYGIWTMHKRLYERSALRSWFIVTAVACLLSAVLALLQVRKTGLDVFMEQSTSDKINQNDLFQMLSTRECEACSTNVGYFAVNKHTADVPDFDADDHRLITGQEMADRPRDNSVCREHVTARKSSGSLTS